MKCDQCGQEATVHELRVVNGKKVERHLCEACARKQGIAVQPALSVPELLEKYIQQAAASPPNPSKPPLQPVPARANVCPRCGTTYMDFRQSGLLGCSECYRSFEGQLGPLLERAHEGGGFHVGKVPKRLLAGGPKASPVARRAPENILGDREQRAGRMNALRKQLEEAVAAEQYERAAKIRDEIRRLSELEQSLEGESKA
jgi:protein arginine kinase activator